MSSFEPKPSIGEIAWLFLRIGLTAFGGPAAHIAMMEQEVVRQRRWLSREEFLDLLGVTNLLPGPNSTEMAIHIGYRKAGAAGLLAAGICFILPSAAIVTAAAWFYVRYGTLPEVSSILYGVKPVILVIVLAALWRLVQTALRNAACVLLALLAAGANVLGAGEVAVLLGMGMLFVLHSRRGQTALPAVFSFGPLAAAGIVSVSPGVAFGLWPLFLFFLKVGSLLFGSGYVLLAFLQSDLVDKNAWLTQSELLDAVAVGQITPGPLFTTATFIGYLLGGGAGAILATIGIFLPAFVLVAFSHRYIWRLRESAAASAFLNGVNVAAVALMGVVSVQLLGAAVMGWDALVLASITAVLVSRYTVNSTWLVLGGAVAGWALQSF